MLRNYVGTLEGVSHGCCDGGVTYLIPVLRTMATQEFLRNLNGGIESVL